MNIAEDKIFWGVVASVIVMTEKEKILAKIPRRDLSCMYGMTFYCTKCHIILGVHTTQPLEFYLPICLVCGEEIKYEENINCECHSPKVLNVANNSSKGQDGEELVTYREASKHDNLGNSGASPSSFETELVKLILIYATDMSADEFKKRLMVLIERDYVKKEDYEKLRIEKQYHKCHECGALRKHLEVDLIEKQKVKDAIQKCTIILERFVSPTSNETHKERIIDPDTLIRILGLN